MVVKPAFLRVPDDDRVDAIPVDGFVVVVSADDREVALLLCSLALTILVASSLTHL